MYANFCNYRIYNWIYKFSTSNKKGYRVVEHQSSSQKKVKDLQAKIKELEGNLSSLETKEKELMNSMRKREEELVQKESKVETLKKESSIF